MNGNPLSSEEIQRASIVAAELVNLVKALEMYTYQHPRSKSCAERCFSSLKEMMEGRNEAQIAYEQSTVFVNGVPLSLAEVNQNPSFFRLGNCLKRKNVYSVNFDRTVTQEHLTSLAKAFATTVTTRSRARNATAFLQEQNVFSIRLNDAAEIGISENPESLLLSHLLDGSLGDRIPEQIRERLFTEIKLYSQSSGLQVLEHVNRESTFSYPIGVRDLFATLGEKWIHFTGSLIRDICGEEAFENEDPLILDLITVLIPPIQSMSVQQRGEETAEFFDQISKREGIEKITYFWRYWLLLDAGVAAQQEFLDRIQTLVTTVVEKALTRNFNSQKILQELREILPTILESPSLYEKVFSAIYELNNPDFVQELMLQTLETLSLMTAPKRRIILAFENRMSTYCNEKDENCHVMIVQVVRNILRAQNDDLSQSLFRIVLSSIEHKCSNCTHLIQCRITDTIASMIQEEDIPISRAKRLIQVWQEAAYQLVLANDAEFQRRIVPMAIHPMNPEDYDSMEMQNLITDAWKSFATVQRFQELFRRLVTDDREERFKAIEELSRYGAFAIWICLGGFNSQNWHLRRNLATVVGRVVDLRQTNLLKEILRDHDWHVRYEIISALVSRSDEMEEELKNNPDHFIIKIFCIALRDGNKTIRNEVFIPIRKYNILPALKSLKDLYNRLAAVNSDNDIEERCKIIEILVHLADPLSAPMEDIIEFITEIAAQKEGLITPNWMIPIKKAAVKGLAAIDHPHAHKALKKLATETPLKRAFVRRLARAALQKK